jgi:hypothetical protein
MVFDAFALKDAERVLIDDMVDIHIADFRNKKERRAAFHQIWAGPCSPMTEQKSRFSAPMQNTS